MKTAEQILSKYEDNYEYHFHKVDREWLIKAMEEYAAQFKSDLERVEKLEAIADILSRIFHYGNFKAETLSERTISGLLNDLGLFPCSEDEIIKRPTWDKFHEQYQV